MILIGSAGSSVSKIEVAINLLALLVLVFAIYSFDWKQVNRDNTIVAAPTPSISESKPAQVNKAIQHRLSVHVFNLFGRANRETVIDSAAEPVRETRLKLVLKGILLQRGTGKGLALIQRSNNEENVYRTGDQIEGAEIVKIDSRRVVLRRNGVNESLTLKVDKLERREFDSPSSNVRPEMIVNAGNDEIQLSRAILQSQLSNLPRLLKQASTIPYQRDGINIGYQVVEVQKNSIFSELGLKTNDVVQSVNGFKVQSRLDALRAYKQLRKEEVFIVNLLRDGQPVTINYSIQ